MGIIKDLKSKLIVSCQPVVGGALDNEISILNIAKAAVDGGAAALRINDKKNRRILHSWPTKRILV